MIDVYLYDVNVNSIINLRIKSIVEDKNYKASIKINFTSKLSKHNKNQFYNFRITFDPPKLKANICVTLIIYECFHKSNISHVELQRVIIWVDVFVPVNLT